VSWNITSTLRSLENKLLTNGYFTHVQIGEPKSPPGQRFTGALFMNAVNTWGTLSTLCAVYIVTLRIYDNMTQEPQEDVEIEMAILVDQIMDDIAGEFDLGATIQAVDMLGMKGTPLGVKWGYVDVSGTMYRIADITIPLIVNDVADMVA